MKPTFQQTFHINALHVDRYGRAKPSSLLYFAQEAAGQHCLDLAVDWNSLAQRHLFWAVIRHRVHVTRLPMLGETITVETWPMPTTRVAYPRSTVAYDAKGNELFRSVSLWVLMDTDTRAMVLPGKSGVEVCGTLQGTELAVPNSILPKALRNTVCNRVGFTELDRNGHMNNTRYMDWIDNLLPSEFHQNYTVKDFTICYLSEAREGQQIDLNWELFDGPSLQVDAHSKPSEDGKEPTRVFSAQVHF